MKSLFWAALLFLALAITSCSNGNSTTVGGITPTPTPIVPTPSPTPTTPSSISVRISPGSALIATTQTLQFSATVTGTANQAVSWQVNNITGGDVTLGTISTLGLYTGPNQVPLPQVITITAVSQADATKAASASVTLSRVRPSAGWERSGPSGGVVTVLAEDTTHPGTIYAGADNANAGALWKSVDDGIHWTPFVTGVTDSVSVFDIAIPAAQGGNVIYVANDGFAVTRDGGQTWNSVSLPNQTQAMAVDPQNANTIYLSSPGTGLFKSIDGGRTWHLLAGSPIITAGSATGAFHNPLAVDTLHSNTVYYGTDHGMFISRDSGLTWSQSTTGFQAADIAMRDVVVSSANPTSVFALAGLDGSTITDLYQSTDQGVSWTLLASGLDAERVIPDSAAPTIIYLSGLQNHAVYKSIDSGHSFAASDTGVPSGASLSAITGPTGGLLILHDGSILLETSGGGIFRSVNSAQTWTSSSTGVSSWLGGAVAVDSQNPSTVYFGSLNFGGIFKSTDTGRTWANIQSGSCDAIAVDPFNSLHILAELSGQGLIESNNGGSTWHSVITLPPPPSGTSVIVSISFHPTRAGTIYISTQSGGVGLLRSTDGGATYTIINNGLSSDHTISRVAVDPQNPNTLFVGTGTGFFKSTNSGDTWSLITPSLTQTISFDNHFNPPVMYIEGQKSLDLGTNWIPILQADLILVDPSTPNSLFGITSFPQQPEWSPDGGVSWFPMNSQFGNAFVNIGFGGGGLAISQGVPQVLFVADVSNGILRNSVGP